MHVFLAGTMKSYSKLRRGVAITTTLISAVKQTGRFSADLSIEFQLEIGKWLPLPLIPND